MKIGDILTYNYTGGQQTVTLAPGYYLIKCYGASGGNGKGIYSDNPTLYQSSGGKGGCAEGKIKIKQSVVLNMFVGAAGVFCGSSTRYNGGGSASDGGSGGGATDIRVDGTALKDRIIVAGGGGGGGCYEFRAGGNGGKGGGIVGSDGYLRYYTQSTGGRGGTQTSGGIGSNLELEIFSAGYSGGFGVGANGRYKGGGAGGGYYGGGGGTMNRDYQNDDYYSGAGGGSSFISGHEGCDSVDVSGVHTGQQNHFSGFIFFDTVTTEGVNSGAGYITIEMISPPSICSVKVSNQYIPATGYTKVNEQWVEITDSYTKVNGVWVLTS